MFALKKNIDFIENNNIKEDRIGVKNLHINKRGNARFANNIFKILKFAFLK